MRYNATCKYSCGLLVALAMVLPLAGCGGGSDPDQMISDANATNLHRLCNLYVLYQTRNGWQGPPDEATFKEFIGSQQDRMLTRMGVEPGNVAAIFTSERDSEPYVIRWGLPGNPRGEPVAVVFEKTGVDGKRMVGFTKSSAHREVEDAEYQQLMSSGS